MKPFYEHYIKLAHIGKGANAHVYKVRHAELGYVRAVKILNEYIEDCNEKVYQSFLKECRTLLTIGNGCHPNIVRIYRPDLIDNHAVVEMDYVQGVTLDSYIKKKGFLEYDEVMIFIRDIVGALAYTHHDIYTFLMNPVEDKLESDPEDGGKYLISPEQENELVKKYGISHNDLHSNNVMRRDYDGRFVLLDFGLAVQDGKCIKSSRMADGNPEYQAPEKFDSEIVSPRSDIYSLGILMYEVLAGRVPFEIQLDSEGKISQRAVNAVLNQHLSVTPPSILPLRKATFERCVPGAVYERDYPEWLDKVIMKCLAKRAEDRYADAKELIDDINEHLENDKETLSSSNEIRQLKANVELLTEQWLFEKNEKEQLKSKIRNSSASSIEQQSHSRWKRGTFVTILLLCVSVSLTWHFRNKMQYYDTQYSAAYKVLRENGLAPDVAVNRVIREENKQAVDRIIRDTVTIHLRDTVRIEVPKTVSQTQTKIEYRISPEVQQELNRLKSENQNLKGQMQRYEESLPK